MNIAIVGCGRLGLPVALSIENKEHKVVGVDVNPEIATYLANKQVPYIEEGIDELIQKTNIKMVGLNEAIEFADIIFVPIQTPSNYDGDTRLPKEKSDYDYSFIKKGISDIAKSAQRLEKHITLIVISTVLPGTVEKHLKPLLNKYVHLAYQPFFVGVGSTRWDFEKPEFILLGCDEDFETLEKIKTFWRTITDAPFIETSIKNAELIKVVYNVYLSGKISFITSVQELCHKIGTNVDEITRALSLATDRIISTKYLQGGNGDGGPCHGKDITALAWIAEQNNLSFNWFENIMKQREAYIEWQADLIEQHQEGLPVVICGKSFKKNINLTVGSPGLLLSNILKERNISHEFYDPIVNPEVVWEEHGESLYPALYFIAMNHDVFKEIKWAKGSVILDLWEIIQPQEGVEVIQIGR